ncbi:MAG: hypothetical protein AAF787_16750 [Chloroflexota bacterium]
MKKIVMVTGATSGIGKATAAAIASQNHTVPHTYDTDMQDRLWQVSAALVGIGSNSTEKREDRHG